MATKIGYKSALDYAEDVLALEAQAYAYLSDAKRLGNPRDLKRAAVSLRGVSETCQIALTVATLKLSPHDRAWFQRHHDKAAAALT